MNSRATIRPYNAHVLVGNWYEDRVMEEGVLKEFLEKRNSGQLASQKMTEVERMSQSVTLSVPAGDGLLRFGHQTMLSNTWTHSAPCSGEKSQQSCCLAMGIPHTATGAKDLTATGTTMMRPTLRTAWIFRRPDLSVDSQTIRYGDEVLISDAQGELFLTCARSSTRAGRTCDVLLTNHRTRSAVWIIMHPNIDLRLEFEGRDVKLNEKILLVHAATNRCLSVNEEHSNRSPYGREFELICELSTGSLSSFKHPLFWTIQTQSPY